MAEPVMRHPARAGNGATPARRRRGIGARAITGLVVIVVAGLMVWAFAGIFVLAFHIFEYAALALVAGWVGYKLGHAKGRHEHRAT